MSATDPSLVVDIPTNPEFLFQFARVSILHAMLDNTLKMYIRTFGDLSIDQVLKRVGFSGSSILREKVWEAGKKRLGDGEALTMLEGLLNRCAALTDKRNELLHSIIGRERDGSTFYTRRRDGTWVELPKAAELATLGEDINELITEMNHQRLAGAIDAALRCQAARSP